MRKWWRRVIIFPTIVGLVAAIFVPLISTDSAYAIRYSDLSMEDKAKALFYWGALKYCFTSFTTTQNGTSGGEKYATVKGIKTGYILNAEVANNAAAGSIAGYSSSVDCNNGDNGLNIDAANFLIGGAWNWFCASGVIKSRADGTDCNADTAGIFYFQSKTDSTTINTMMGYLKQTVFNGIDPSTLLSSDPTLAYYWHLTIFTKDDCQQDGNKIMDTDPGGSAMQIVTGINDDSSLNIQYYYYGGDSGKHIGDDSDPVKAVASSQMKCKDIVSNFLSPGSPVVTGASNAIKSTISQVNVSRCSQYVRSNYPSLVTGDPQTGLLVGPGIGLENACTAGVNSPNSEFLCYSSPMFNNPTYYNQNTAAGAIIAATPGIDTGSAVKQGITDGTIKQADYENQFKIINACLYGQGLPPVKGQGIGTGTDSGDDDSSTACDQNGASFAWVLCPMIDKGFTGLQGLFQDVLDAMFRYDPTTSDNSGQMRAVWQNFVNIANIMLVIAFLIIIYSAATGGGNK